MRAESVETVNHRRRSGRADAQPHAQGRARDHVVLERARIAERWRSERWDGLRFQFPNWSVHFPDFPFPHADPEGFATSGEIVDFLAAYADFITAPVRCGVTVTALRRRDGGAGFVLETSDGPIGADNVVVATGPYQVPIVPTLLPDDAGLYQVHASRYRGAGSAPGRSRAGRGLGDFRRPDRGGTHARRPPRLPLGRPTPPHAAPISRTRPDMVADSNGAGSNPGREARAGQDPAPDHRGIRRSHDRFPGLRGAGNCLLGRLESMSAGTLHFASDLADSLRSGDVAYTAFLDLVDGFVARQGLDVPEEADARTLRADPACVVSPVRSSGSRRRRHRLRDLARRAMAATSAGSIFRSFDGRGEPLHREGIADVPGLYFLGLQWLSRMNSSFLVGVAEDAARLADHIAARSSEKELIIFLPARSAGRCCRLSRAKRGISATEGSWATGSMWPMTPPPFGASPRLRQGGTDRRWPRWVNGRFSDDRPDQCCDAVLCGELAALPAGPGAEADRSGDFHERPRPLGGGGPDGLRAGGTWASPSSDVRKLVDRSRRCSGTWPSSRSVTRASARERAPLVLIGGVQLTMLYVAWREGERFSLLSWLGLGLALIGVIYLALPGVSAPDPLGSVLMDISAAPPLDYSRCWPGAAAIPSRSMPATCCGACRRWRR